MWRLIFGIPGWLLYFALMTPLVLLGFPLIAIQALLFRVSATNDRDTDGWMKAHWRDRWMWLWDNKEDGVNGWAMKLAHQFEISWKNPEWVARTKAWDVRLSYFIWSAWRNSVGNARWTRLFGMTVDPAQVKIVAVGKSRRLPPSMVGPYLVRQGWRYELRFPWNDPGLTDWTKQRFFWVGWRIAQQTQKTEGVGFAFQPWGKL